MSGQCPDLVLIHPPSVFNFRTRRDLLMLSLQTTLVSASPAHEIPPLGLWALREYLQGKGFSVKVLNLAEQMLQDEALDVKKLLGSIKARLIGISLHWLINADGALAISEILRETQPNVPIVFGGISASVFAHEVIDGGYADYVIAGNLTFEPLADLLLALKQEKSPDHVPNLHYRQGDQPSFTHTKLYSGRHIPPLDWRTLQNSGFAVDSVVLNPQTGCRYSCCYCGGGAGATREYGHQAHPVQFKSGDNLIQEMASLQQAVNAPGQSGIGTKLTLINHWHCESEQRLALLEQLREKSVFSRVYVYVMHLPDVGLMREMARAAPITLIISPNSHDEHIRERINTSRYSNDALESWIESALACGIHSVEICFMLGLPGQSPESIRQTCEYTDHLLSRFAKSRKVFPLISPMFPFLDIASPAFNNPGKYGYKLFSRSLAEHRESLLEPALHRRLNYETEWMNRREIIDTTFKSAISMGHIRARHGYLPVSIAERMNVQLHEQWELSERIAEFDGSTDELIEKYGEQIATFNHHALNGTTCDQSPLPPGLFKRRHWYQKQH